MNTIFKKILPAFAFITWTNIAFGQQVKTDHIICIVKDIEKATKEYENKGFTQRKAVFTEMGSLTHTLNSRTKIP